MRYLFAIGCLSLSGCLVDLVRPNCSDGFLDPGEECDSGVSNGGNGERCNAKCAEEAASFSIEDINGTQVNGARFAIFTQTVAAFDSDADTINDLDGSSLVIIISNQGALCAQLGLDPDFINNASDIEAISVTVFKDDALGQGGFLSGQTLLSIGSPLDIFLAPVAGLAFVGATVTVRREGVTLINANDNLIFPPNGDILQITSITDDTLEASLSSTLFLDISGQAAFNVDIDLNGTNESTGIEASLTAAVHNATFCPNL